MYATKPSCSSPAASSLSTAERQCNQSKMLFKHATGSDRGSSGQGLRHSFRPQNAWRSPDTVAMASSSFRRGEQSWLLKASHRQVAGLDRRTNAHTALLRRYVFLGRSDLMIWSWPVRTPAAVKVESEAAPTTAALRNVKSCCFGEEARPGGAARAERDPPPATGLPARRKKRTTGIIVPMGLA